MEDISEGQIDLKLTDTSIPTPDIVLDAAINAEKSQPPSVTGEQVLLTEAGKPAGSESTTNLKSLPIDNSFDVPKTAEPKSAES